MDDTYLHCTPAADVDSDLYSTKSTEIRSNERCTGTLPVGDLGRRCADFLRWHAQRSGCVFLLKAASMSAEFFSYVRRNS